MSSEGGARAARLLLELGKGGASGISLQELASAFDQPKPTLLRTINSLIEHGFAEQVARGRYRLGPSIYALARTESAVVSDVASWRPVLEKLARTFGQTIHLVRRAGWDVVIIDMQLGDAPVQVLSSGIGGRLPMGIGSGSLAILASLDTHDQEAIISANAMRYAQWSLNAERVAEIVKRATIDGHSSDVGLIIPDCGGIGVPIREGGRYTANTSITLTAPLRFFSENKVAVVAEQMKREIAENLAAHKEPKRKSRK